jgi:hypothetical protein
MQQLRLQTSLKIYGADILSGGAAVQADEGRALPISVEEAGQFRLMREFWAGPKEFVEAMLEE